MARPLRIEIEDGLYYDHITGRSWEGRAIVRGGRNRQRWLELLDRAPTCCGRRILPGL